MKLVLRILKWALIVASAAPLAIEAAEPSAAQSPKLVSQILNVIAAQEDYFQRIQSFKEIATTSCTVDPSEVKRFGKPEFTSHLTYLADGNLYWYELKQQDNLQKQYFWYQNSFDGTTYSALNKDRSRLTVSQVGRLPADSGFTVNRNAFYEPFVFLANDKFGVMWLNDLKTPRFWEKALANSAIVASTYKNSLSEVTELRFPGPTIKINDQNCDTIFTVDFANSMSFLPLRWIWQSKDGSEIAQYEILKIGTVKSGGPNSIDLPVPVDAHYENFSNGHLSYSAQFHLDSLELNPRLNVEQFTIDPGQASEIYDWDKNVTIRVPK